MALKVVFLLFCAVYLASAADEGDSCVKDGLAGTCINIGRCPSAIADLKKRKRPQICGYVGSDSIVCCVSSSAPPATPNPPTPKPTPAPPKVTRPTPRPPQPTPEDQDECEPIDPSQTSKKNGRKAWDKCLEYQEALVYPCKSAVSILGGKQRQNRCHHNTDELIVGGEDAGLYEITHMVMLGYGENEAFIQWQCGGSLISEQWVLTAGHCTYNRNYGIVKFVRVGALQRSDPLTSDNLRRVAKYLNAPGYQINNRYNDLALVQMDKTVELSDTLVPACVHIGDQVPEDRVQAAGWGLTQHQGNISNILQKVTLKRFTPEECSDQYPPGDRHMLWGLEEASQTCYGDKEEKKDTCQGDSGGPIHIKSKKMDCMYVVTGVTSFGKRCGRVGEPGIYTRVSNYADWIEKTVWP